MSRKTGFTLVELLVVVAIIALLVSILLPSLETSREQARSVTCAARLHDIANAGNVYGNLFGEWLAGSPGTTGMELLYTGGTPLEVEIPTIPVQTWDWQSPLAFYSLGYSDFANLTNRSERWQRLRTLEIFNCPSNNFIAPPFYSEGSGHGQTGPFPDWPIMPMNSYTTIKPFIYFGRPCDIRLGMSDCESQAQLDGISSQIYFPSGAGGEWGIRTPQGHVPRLSNIEGPGGKVWVADGARFAPTGISPIDFDVNFRAGFGGAFSSNGASSAWSRAYVNSMELESMEDSRHDRYAYRHPKGSEPALNMLFFDGHAEAKGKLEAIMGADMWYPRGSILNAEEIIPSSNSATKKPRAWDELSKREPVVGIDGANPFYLINWRRVTDPMVTKILLGLSGLLIIFGVWRLMSSGLVGGYVEPTGYKAMNVETGYRYAFDMDADFAGWPAKCPDTGEKNLYPAEVCRREACKAVEGGTWVVLNTWVGKDGPTKCPNCGSIVTVHNEMQGEEELAASKDQDKPKKKPRRRGRRGRGGS